MGIAAGWLTWFVNLERTMFIFYMAPVVPFFVMAVALGLRDVARPASRAAAAPAELGLGAVSLYVALVLVNFAFFLPVLTGLPLSHEDWLPGCGSPPGSSSSRPGSASRWSSSRRRRAGR